MMLEIGVPCSRLVSMVSERAAHMFDRFRLEII
jgi:hypothetical protein